MRASPAGSRAIPPLVASTRRASPVLLEEPHLVDSRLDAGQHGVVGVGGPLVLDPAQGLDGDGGGVEVAVVRAVGASVEYAEVDEHMLVGQGGAELRRRDGAEHRLNFAYKVGHRPVPGVMAVMRVWVSAP